jgi:hypothetical protein
MTHEERNTLVGIFVNLLENTWILLRLKGQYNDGLLTGTDGLSVFGKTVLLAIPASIVLTIVGVILFNILFAIVTRDENPDFIVDERDQMFKIRGMSVTMIVSAIGFIAAMSALALGYAALTVFLIMYLSFALGDLTGNVIKLASYRGGV